MNEIYKYLPKRDWGEYTRQFLPPQPSRFLEGIKDWNARMEILLPNLSKAGWTISPNWSCPQVEWIATQANNKADIDEDIFEFYSYMDNKELNELFDRFVNGQEYICLDKWRILLQECISVFNQGYFRSLVPCLISVIEGLLSEITANPNDIHVMKACKEQIDKQADSSSKLAWISISNFITEIFAKNDFSNDRHILINRHRILHGRDNYMEWKPIDAIRLFNTVECIAWAISETKP